MSNYLSTLGLNRTTVECKYYYNCQDSVKRYGLNRTTVECKYGYEGSERTERSCGLIELQ